MGVYFIGVIGGVFILVMVMLILVMFLVLMFFGGRRGMDVML